MKERLAIEIYRYTQAWLPTRFRLAMKRFINDDKSAWQRLKKLRRRLDNTPFLVELDMRHWSQRWTYIKGYYPEPHISNLLIKFLRKDSFFLDIGANIGIHSLSAAAIIAEARQVWAVEPNPTSFSCLKRHAGLNQLDLNIHQLALGNARSTVHLQGCDDAHVGSTIRQTGDDGCEVMMLKGDELFAAIPHDASGICKIDVEGYEFEVLQGLLYFIEKHENFSYIVEVTPAWLQSLGSSAENLFNIFLTRGFAAYEVQLSGLQAIDKPLEKNQYDMLFTKPSILQNRSLS